MIALYSITIFLSATLLFSIQPMVGKMLLPRLGGSPAVWNTCMVFFQAMLLAGYAYAHGTAHRLGARRQAVIHVLMMLVPFVVLPIAIGTTFNPPPDANPILPLLTQLTLAVALPFAVVSAGAPLLQNWFSQTNHRSADDPYFLYSASNLGSMVALLGYPFLIEPRWTLAEQAHLWTGGYAMLVAFAVICAATMWLFPRPSVATDVPVDDAPPVSGRKRLHWVILSFVPSSLMLGVTTHVTTDIAAVPLLWVVPLALYLLTFVIAFARRRIVSTQRLSWMLPYLLLPLALLTYSDFRKWSWAFGAAHMLVFLVASLVCHCRLADDRPPARRLTEFYLWISIGGVLGGIFNAMVAPLLFVRVIEYPLMLVAACLLRTAHGSASTSPTARRNDVLAPALLATAMIGLVYAFAVIDFETWWLVIVALFGVPAMLCFSFKDRPLRFALGFGAIMLSLGMWWDVQKGGVLYSSRNFFGVKRVVQDDEHHLRKLFHGLTQHGVQSAEPDRRRTPLAYYTREGPLGDLFTAFDSHDIRRRVAAIGLGAGAVATYARPGDHFTFYEIDPEVAQIAEDPELFTYLSDCPGEYDIVLGDGRRTLEAATDGEYGMLVLDAFSSDAVPTHLLTREAVELYLSKVRHDGVIAMHISNRYLSFRPMLGNLAAHMGLTAIARTDRVTDEAQDAGASTSQWVVIGAAGADLDRLMKIESWTVVPESPGTPIWTDQFCDIVALFVKN